ncbi:Endonuclease YncB, thermonuclease family [Paracoccus halophilus]|uniref:Endonuclease YncB, thermonuclease family n=1 Tax=Paracoccus halophilus TaxID=376733 RepID=A0A1I0UCA3_9RHOB|nr:thermonuclease family protein [Paracoccus halophilus]SFA61702.1 Endonuclease YncB, thermonuclease family [Paracoccus halophilus]
MFSMEMNREQLLEDIRRVLEIAPSQPKEDADPPAGQNPSGGSPFGQGGERQSVRVIDGDTLMIGGETWRLLGIDVPEMKQSCRMHDGREYPCGAAARAALAALIGDLEVSCEQSDTDRYGRRVGICRAGDKDLGKELVSAGMAVAYLEYTNAYQLQGEAARAARLGLWSGDFEMPNEFRKAN